MSGNAIFELKDRVIGARLVIDERYSIHASYRYVIKRIEKVIKNNTLIFYIEKAEIWSNSRGGSWVAMTF